MSDTNLNIAECLKNTTDFGMTHVRNVCNGTVTEVPWGSADWALSIGLIGFGVAVLLVFAGFGIMMIRDA